MLVSSTTYLGVTLSRRVPEEAVGKRMITFLYALYVQFTGRRANWVLIVTKDTPMSTVTILPVFTLSFGIIQTKESTEVTVFVEEETGMDLLPLADIMPSIAPLDSISFFILVLRK
jgi:hypothetical protein